jgi:phosphoglycolate phosphatase
MTAPVAGAFDLVMFDLDGTLVETAPEIQDAVNDTLVHFGFEPVTLEQVERWIGHGTAELLLQALALRCGSNPQAVRGSELMPPALERFSRDYARRCGTRSRLYPQVQELLRALGRRGVKRAVVTNKEHRFVDSVMRVHDLQDLVDRVVCGDTLPTRKPDPAGLLDCMREFGVSAGRALFVGDSAIDVACARNAGVAVWALTHGYNMGEPISAARPDRVLDNLEPFLEEVTS